MDPDSKQIIPDQGRMFRIQRDSDPDSQHCCICVFISFYNDELLLNFIVVVKVYVWSNEEDEDDEVMETTLSSSSVYDSKPHWM